MKQHILSAIGFTVTFSLIFTACGKAAGANADLNISGETGASSDVSVQAEQTRTAGKLSWLPITCGGFWGTNTGDAYYEYARLGDNSEAVILKTDYATAEQTAICQKDGCAHAEKSCNAYIENWGRMNLCAIQDALYLICTSMTPFEPTPEEQAEIEKSNAAQREALATQAEKEEFDAILKRFQEMIKADNLRCSSVDKISTDGTQKQRIAEFPRDWEVTFCATDGAMLYGYRNAGEMQIQGASLEGVWLDLATGEYGTYPLGIGSVIGVYENMLVFTSVDCEQNMQLLLESGNEEAVYAAEQNATMQYYAVNPFTGEQKLLAETPYTGGYAAGVFDGKLYYVEFIGETGGDYSLQCFSLATGAKSTIGERFKNSYSIDAYSYMAPGKESEQQYLRVAVTSMTTGATEKYILLDVNTGGQSEVLTRAAADEYGSTASILAAQTNDGRWLVHTGSATLRHNSRAKYALVAPADFIAGKPALTEVKMYEDVR